jgi:hypothetical protein
MSLRISSALGLLVALAACGAESSPPPPGTPDSADQPGSAVDCAIGGVADLSPVCTLELIAGTQEIVIHHPDGGFRRFTRDPATGDLAPFDGAEPLVPQAGEGGATRFAVGPDRYSIPAELLAPARE